MCRLLLSCCREESIWLKAEIEIYALCVQLCYFPRRRRALTTFHILLTTPNSDHTMSGIAQGNQSCNMLQDIEVQANDILAEFHTQHESPSRLLRGSFSINNNKR